MQFPYPHVFTQKTTRQTVTVTPRPVVFESGQLLHSITGDCVDVLPTLPEQIINCVVTSPPYYGLRDYGLPKTDWPEISYPPMAGLPALTIPAQSCCLGLEDSPEAYIAHMVYVFRLVRRVLRDDGVCWVNMGDSYAASPPGGKNPVDRYKNWKTGGIKKFENIRQPSQRRSLVSPDIPAKNLLMMPARLALALQADGWVLRSDIVWAKGNPMPESVTDRPTKAHEYIYLLSKEPRYWYHQEAIREPNSENSGKWGKSVPPKTAEAQASISGKHGATSFMAGELSHEEVIEKYYTNGRNKRTVWHVNTRGYPAAHFAVFPPELIEPCVLAGCPPKVCDKCGAPYVREVEREAQEYNDKEGTAQALRCAGVISGGTEKVTLGKTHLVKRTDKGFKPTCDCNADTRPGIVLDPFAGSGTTGRVAVKHRRRAILIDLSEEYAELQKDRTQVQITLPGVV